jgi:hypothetical protein
MDAFIYLTDEEKLKHLWSKTPFDNYTNYAYISEDVIKDVLTEDEFNDLKLKIRLNSTDKKCE